MTDSTTTEHPRPAAIYDGPTPLPRPAKHTTPEAREVLGSDLSITLSVDNWAMIQSFIEVPSVEAVGPEYLPIREQVASARMYIAAQAAAAMASIDGTES